MEPVPREENYDWLALIVGNPETRERIISELTEEERKKVLSQALCHVSAFMAQGHPKAAQKMLQIAKDVAGGLEDLIYFVLIKEIKLHDFLGDRKRAVQILEALYKKYYRKRAYARRAAELAMELGIMLDKLGCKERALKLFQSARKRYERLGDTYNCIAAEFNAASILYDLGRFRASLNACRRCLKAGAEKYVNLAASVRLQLANCLDKISGTEESTVHYRVAARYYGRLGNRKQESDILYRLGWLAMRSDIKADLEVASRDLQRALELKREYDYALGLARYYFALAEVTREIGLTKKSLVNYRQALAFAMEIGKSDLSEAARFGLYRVLERPSWTLPSFMKLKLDIPDSKAAVRQGRKLAYVNLGKDGGRTELWKDSKRSVSTADGRRYLARLLRDLSKLWKERGVSGYRDLYRQVMAVVRWSNAEAGEV